MLAMGGDAPLARMTMQQNTVTAIRPRRALMAY